MNDLFTGITQKKNSCPNFPGCYNGWSEHDCPECKGFKTFIDGVMTWDTTDEGKEYFKAIRKKQHIKDAINAKKRKQYAKRKKEKDAR
ncbi:MAG: hypothetical protein D4S01_10445 [Dehalococcoidia bacterium]|nr:MAG: hypothetical protein D4S01_10445 [Dehalococcoidia bacterium]